MSKFMSLHNLDLLNTQITSKSIPKDFEAFTKEYLLFARSNESIKNYTIIDENTQVISCVLQLFRLFTSHDIPKNEISEQYTVLSTSIAERLLRSEMEVQEKISPMNKHIKKGSLIQSIIKERNLEDSYLYIVAKVEHSEWFDGESLAKSFGFPSEKKNVWKSAVIPAHITSDGILLGSIRVYTDNEAKYWTKSFLEIVEEKSDEANTKLVFTSVDRELRKALFTQHPRDFYLLRNAFIQRLKREELFNYSEHVTSLFQHYEPYDSDIDINEIEKTLLALPEKKRFDTQFTPVSKVVTARQKLRFIPSSGIELRVDGSIDNYKDAIIADLDDNEQRILKIKCPDFETYTAFGGK